MPCQGSEAQAGIEPAKSHQTGLEARGFLAIFERIEGFPPFLGPLRGPLVKRGESTVRVPALFFPDYSDANGVGIVLCALLVRKTRTVTI